MSTDSPFKIPSLIESLVRVEREVAEFFDSLSPDEMALRVGDAWTPAEHLDHLNIAVSAVAGAFQRSRWLLRIRFGRARRAARTYDQLRDDYRARLAQGRVATGRFAPVVAERTQEEAIARRKDLLARWQRVNARLQRGLNEWTERDVDRIQLPHPLLGKITAREMVLFTIYHNQHHVVGAKSRLPRFRSQSAN